MFTGLMSAVARGPTVALAMRRTLLGNSMAAITTSHSPVLFFSSWIQQSSPPLQTTLVPPQSLSLHHQQPQLRHVHSNRQIKKKFKNPRRDRLDRQQGIDRSPTPPPKVEYQPIWEPNVLPNGWCKPPSEDVSVPEYPFHVGRTKNKPFGAVGFLPIYLKLRHGGMQKTTRVKKVTGDRGRFIQELRAVLQIPTPKNPNEDTIRVRMGGTIEVKGNHVKSVREWLYGLGF